jgi:hypothetical protein
LDVEDRGGKCDAIVLHDAVVGRTHILADGFVLLDVVG